MVELSQARKRVKARELIRDYHWMIKEIERIESTIEVTVSTTKYGDEPKAISQGTVSDPVGRMVIHREDKVKRIRELERKVQSLNSALNEIQFNDRDRTVIHLMLEGESITNISRHLNIARKNAYKIINRVCQYIGNHIYAKK